MKRRISVYPMICLLLLLAAAKARACDSGSVTITNLSDSAGSTFQVTGLNSAGQLTGYYYGSLPAHAFLYQGGAVLDLGTFGGTISEGFAINFAGQVVGDSYLSGNLQLNAFEYSGGNLVNLGTLGGGYSSAKLINDLGQVAGLSVLPGAFDSTAFLYANGSMISLGTLGGTYSSAFALNNAGQLAGESSLANGDIHAFLYSGAGLVDLGTLGGDYSSASAINDAGTVVGESSDSNSDTHGFVFTDGIMSDLGTFGGTFSSAFHVNTNGQVVGIATTAGDAGTHAFISDGNGLVDLGTLGGATAVPYAINNRDQVVGMATLSDGTPHAFMWQKGQLVDLNTLLSTGSGWQLSNAQFINDAGRIVGLGLLNGSSQWFIMDPPSGNNPPVAVAGPNQTVDCQAQVTLDGSGSSDPDNDPLTFEWSSGGNVLGTSATLTISLPLGTNVVTLKVTDTCGASAQNNVTVIVADTTPPIGTCPAPVTVSADATCQAAVPNLAAQVIASDNCTPMQALVITQDPAAGTLVGLGVHPVNIKVTDTSGNSSACTVMFTVADTTPPTILSTPAALTLSAGSDCQVQVPNVLGGVVATDTCTPANQLVKTQSPAAGTLIGVGTYNILVTVTDGAGNTATANVSLKVADTTAPTILSGPGAIKLSADANCQAAVPNVLGAILAADNCTPASQLVLKQNPTAGTVLPRGFYTIAVTATDAAGNSAGFNVPLEIDDLTPPTMVGVPSQLTISAGAKGQAVVANLLPGIIASDNCTPASQLVMVQTPTAGTSLPVGNYTIVVSASDAAGNTTSMNVSLSVVDTTAPVIQSLAASPNMLSPPNHQLVPVTVSAAVSDNCDPSPVTRIVSIGCSEPANPGDIQITGPLTANLAASKDASGTTRTYTITVQSTDASGNSSTGVVTVTVPKSSSTPSTWSVGMAGIGTRAAHNQHVESDGDNDRDDRDGTQKGH